MLFCTVTVRIRLGCGCGICSLKLNEVMVYGDEDGLVSLLYRVFLDRGNERDCLRFAIGF